MTGLKPPYRYKTRHDVPPDEIIKNPHSVLYVGDDVNMRPFDRLDSSFRLVQINVSEHARQARVAIGSCSMLADLVKIPPQYRLWRPDVQLFVNASTSRPITFLGGGSFLNANEAHVRELPGGYFLGFNNVPRKPIQDPFSQTNIAQITGPDTDGNIKTWSTITTSRIVDSPDLPSILINTARAVGIDSPESQDMFAKIISSELENSRHHPPGLGPIAMGHFKTPS